ncbi:MAG: flavodoxin domain-containing protein [Myxococcota bacterium]|jgi:menaquinone-dependent protoporphyrinogen IX oxidase|nr:flavodoxin domain-containing protein [Myxococcota bacterium]
MKKGLLAYESQYGSAADVSYWIRSIVGLDQHLDVKKYNQILTVEPYDYVIIGGYTRWEKPHKSTYQFIERFHDELAKKEVAYFLTCGEVDETIVINMPGAPPHISSGRSYFLDTVEKFPSIKPVTLGAFGGRQVNRYLKSKDARLIWLLGKTMPPDKVGWTGLDMWESLVPERVEAFANDIRTKILSLRPLDDVKQYRVFWESLQPGNLLDPSVKKFSVRPWTITQNEKRCYFSRSRFKGNLSLATSLLERWAQENGLELKLEKKTYYNTYFRAQKSEGSKAGLIHIVIADVIEDPGNVHVSFRCYTKPSARKAAEDDIQSAEKILWADGRKVD